MHSSVQVNEPKTPAFVYIIASLSALGGFLFGYDTGVISGALLFIKGAFNLVTFEQEVAVAILLLFAAFAAPFAGKLADAIGRRRTILIAAALFIIGALFMTGAPGFGLFVAGRAVVGLAIGISSFTVPLYISELSPPTIRGLCVSLNQLMVTVGIVVAYIVDLSFAEILSGWRWMLGLSIIPAAILFIAMWFLPETPRWLAKNNHLEQARAIFKKIGNSDKDFDGLVVALEENLRVEKGGLRELFSHRLRRPLMIGMLLAFFQQVTGINTIIYYSPIIFQQVGLDSAVAALWATSSVGVINVLSTLLALWLLDRIGRRPLLIWGISSMIIGLLALGIDWLAPAGEERAIVAIASLMVYIFGFAIGLGPIAWLFIAEIYPLKVRGIAMSCATMVNWGFNFLIALTFLTLIELMGASWTFWLYGLLSLFSLIFVIFWIPETKGKTLEEIERLW